MAATSPELQLQLQVRLRLDRLLVSQKPATGHRSGQVGLFARNAFMPPASPLRASQLSSLCDGGAPGERDSI